MQKILVIALCLLFSINFSMACTDFTGSYQYSDSPSGQVDFQYIQTDCNSIVRIKEYFKDELNQDFQLIMSIRLGNTTTDFFEKVSFTESEMVDSYKIKRTENDQVEEENIVLKVSKLASGDLSILATYDDGQIKAGLYRKVSSK